MEADSTHNLGHLDWVNKLEEMARQKGKDGGQRGYICLKEGTVELYQSKREAKSAGFKPLTYKAITDLTLQKMEGCVDVQILNRAAQAMDRIAQVEEKTKGKKNLTKTFSAIFPQVSKMEKSTDELETNVSVHFSKRLTETLHHSIGITRSSSGLQGVIFVETDGEAERIVIKTSRDPVPELGAERLMDLMGFTTPRSVPVEKRSNEGKLLSETLLKHAPKMIDPVSYRESIASEIESANYFFVMECLNATSFEDLLANQKKEILQDAHLLQQIGEIVLYDQFTGNLDRLSDLCNEGNFMLLEGTEGRSLAIIDSVIDTNLDTSEENLDSLLSGKMKVGNALVEALTDYSQSSLDEKQVAFVSENIAEGIKIGAKKLVARLSEEGSFSSFLDLPGTTPSANVNIEVLERRLEKIKDFKES